MRSMTRSCFGVAVAIALLVSMMVTFPAEAQKKVTIGTIVPTLNAQFWNRYVEFMQTGAGQLGVELIVLNADNNADRMVQYLEDLIARGVDGIIYVPYWGTGFKGIMDANLAGIPVITTDTYPEDLNPGDVPNYVAFIGPSDEDAGYRMGKALFAATEAAADGKKYIGVVNGTPGTSVAIDRRKGLQRALDEHPEVVVVGEVQGNFVRDESQEAMEALYQAHPEIKGVWAANGATATGVMTALKNAGVPPGKDVQVVAMDLNPENIEAIERGELLFDIGGHWLQGGFALVMMYDYLHGYEVPQEYRNVKLSLLPVTADTVDEFHRTYPDGVPDFDFRHHSRVYNPDAPPPIVELPHAGN